MRDDDTGVYESKAWMHSRSCMNRSISDCVGLIGTMKGLKMNE
jgi:hypothetical protein